MTWEEIFSPDKTFLTIAALATVALFFVSLLAGLTIRRRQRELMEECRYRPRKRLMEGAEKRCFQLLIELFGHKYYIIPQVELSALLNHKVGTQDRTQAKRFLEDKVVDFVLCNKRTLRPVCAVKLDEAEASRSPVHAAKVKSNSNLKNSPGSHPADMRKFFRSAHLPFVYLPRRADITRQNVIDEFSRVIYETSRLGK